MELRLNRAKHKLQVGAPVLVPVTAVDSDSIERLGVFGIVDAVWIVDMEHGAWTWRDLGDISRACDLAGITSMVRVQSNDPSEIGRVLDLGIQSVVVPHVNNARDAERAVKAALYAPLGLRGMHSPRQSYGVANYFQRANEELMVVLMIEELEAIENLDEILTVDHVDCFFIAPNDLSQSMGPEYMGRPFAAEVQKVVREAVRQTVAAGRAAGTLVNGQTISDYVNLGVRFLLFPVSIEETLRSFSAAVKSAQEMSAAVR